MATASRHRNRARAIRKGQRMGDEVVADEGDASVVVKSAMPTTIDVQQSKKGRGHVRDARALHADRK